jgi:hypothetical protein
MARPKHDPQSPTNQESKIGKSRIDLPPALTVVLGDEFLQARTRE